MLVVENGKKQLFSISNGKLPLQSMVGQKLEFTVYKPDGKPLKTQTYMATRVKNNPVEFHLDVDITKGSTAQNDPEINKKVKAKDCPSECVVQTISFDTTPGPYIISMEMWKNIRI